MKEALKLALEALEDIKDDCSGCEFEWSNDYPLQAKAHTAIKKVLARGEQEPVACIHRIVDVTNKVVKSGYMCMDCGAVFRAYTTPPQRKPLTDEQIAEMWLEILGSTPPSGIHEDGLQPWRFARAIEAAHGIKE